MPVALVRILLAAGVMVALLPVYFLVGPGEFVLPTGGQVAWLLVSGLMGIVIGDSLTYESLVTLGPRRTTQLYTLQPVAAVTAGYALGETLGAGMLLGIGVVIVATAAAIFARPAEDDDATGEPGRLTKLGLAYGIGGALFRGLGAVAGREAFRTGPALDPFLATTIRIVGSTAVVWILPVVRGNVRETIGILKVPGVARRVWAGTIVGPIIGMICYVSALKNAPAGLVATIVSTSPLLVLPYVTVKYHAKLGVVTPVAAAVACGGVAVISDPGIVVRVLQVLHALRVM